MEKCKIVQHKTRKEINEWRKEKDTKKERYEEEGIVENMKEGNKNYEKIKKAKMQKNRKLELQKE